MTCYCAKLTFPLIYLLITVFFLVMSLKTSGDITYNGHHFNEFVPQRTSAYVSQQDWHVAEMTVRETLDFAGRCQGVGFKYGRDVRNMMFNKYLR